MFGIRMGLPVNALGMSALHALRREDVISLYRIKTGYLNATFNHDFSSPLV
jgi:hypothetical protein